MSLKPFHLARILSVVVPDQMQESMQCQSAKLCDECVSTSPSLTGSHTGRYNDIP